MTYQEACLRLANHSNLAGERLPAEDSFAQVLRNASLLHAPVDLNTLIADIVRCLEVVNREWHGPLPSKSFAQVGVPGIVEVAYAVSGIIVEGLRYLRRWERDRLFGPHERDALAEAVHRVAYAWDQVLAGDVENLLEGIERL
jgi:hypothetical protein